MDASTQSAALIASVENAVRRFSTQITRIEIHLSDENSHKGGNYDKRCVLEALLEGLPPMAASHQVPMLNLAVNGAAKKLKTALENCIGKLRD